MAGDYIIMKATELSKQAAAYKAAHTLDQLSITHYAMRKYDGCHLIVRTFIEGGAHSFECLSRTGEVVQSCDHIGAAVLRHLGPGWVVQGEAWIPGTAFPEISGAFRRHSPQEQLQFIMYDRLPSADFALGEYDLIYAQRLLGLFHMQLFSTEPLRLADYYNPGSYGDPLKLAHLWCDEKFALHGGNHYDGLVLWDPRARWVRGTSRNGALIKVKPNVSFDLRVKGITHKPGDKTGREVVALVVGYHGKDLGVGSGIPHDLQAAWLENPLLIIDKIVEVEAMGVSSEGLLREPRFKGIRHDKLRADA